MSIEELQHNFDLINNLNNIYNLNQHIFDKHKLFECSDIAKFLKCFQGYAFVDIPMYRIDKDPGTIELFEMQKNKF